MNQPRYALVQSRFETIEMAVLVDALAANTKLARPDLMQLARKARGILGDRFSHAEALAVQAALAAERVQTHIVPAEQIVPLGRPLSVSWLEVNEAHLGVPLGLGEQIDAVASWPGVMIVHAAVVAVGQETSQIVGSGSSAYGFGSANPEDAPGVELRRQRYGEMRQVLGLLCVSDVGQPLHLRLTMPRLHTQRMPWLPAEVSRDEQFRFLLQQLVRLATGAVITPSARKLSVQPPKGLGVRTAESQTNLDESHFSADMNWLYQLVVLRERGADR